MADFNNLALTTSGIKALLAAQAGTTLTLSKIGMGSGSTNNFTSLGNLVTPEVMLPISEKRIDEESGFMSIVAKMTNKDITEGFYWRETGLFFEDDEGNDVLFAYACVVDNQYDYVPAYSDKRYVKHVRIANIIKDSANIEIAERKGLLYVDTLTFEEYKGGVKKEFEENNGAINELRERPVNNNILINSNFANPVNQRGYDGAVTSKSGYTIDRWKLNAGQAFDINSDGITFKPASTTAYFVQKIEGKGLKGKTVTLSMKINGQIHLLTTIISEENASKSLPIDTAVNMTLDYDASTDIITVGLTLKNATPIIEWAKLELGKNATPYVPRLYSEEWILCQRYYQRIPLRDAVLWGITNLRFSFAKSLTYPMRVAPSVIIESGTTIQYNKDNTFPLVLSGCTFDIETTDQKNIYIRADKTSHGLTASNTPTAGGYAIADAEI